MSKLLKVRVTNTLIKDMKLNFTTFNFTHSIVCFCFSSAFPQYPYIPAHITKPKEQRKLFLVQLGEKGIHLNMLCQMMFTLLKWYFDNSFFLASDCESCGLIPFYDNFFQQILLSHVTTSLLQHLYLNCMIIRPVMDQS